MDFILEFASRIWPFLAVLTPVIFFHELGHFLVARWNGVQVEIFSIGFGGEIFGWNDKHGTRWRVSWVPLGGYVKFFGDAGASSGEGEGLDEMTAEERAVSFHHKGLWQRASIVVAGPVANFVLAVVIFAVMFATLGRLEGEPRVLEVLAGSAAEEVGLKTGDLILTLDGKAIERLRDLQDYVQPRPGEEIRMEVSRDGKILVMDVVPTATDRDVYGRTITIGQIGISGPVRLEKKGPIKSIWLSVEQSYAVADSTLSTIANVIAGKLPFSVFSGPVGIAHVTSEVARVSLLSLIQLAAVISVAIGLFNLFPIPFLDGGHLVFYGAEALRGKPLSERAQEFSMRIGLIALLTFFVAVTFKDIETLGVFSFLGGLFG